MYSILNDTTRVRKKYNLDLPHMCTGEHLECWLCASKYLCSHLDAVRVELAAVIKTGNDVLIARNQESAKYPLDMNVLTLELEMAEESVTEKQEMLDSLNATLRQVRELCDNTADPDSSEDWVRRAFALDVLEILEESQ